MDFIYDEQGRPRAMIYNNVRYFYVLNLQGDVIRIVNTTGTTMASYVYDAWGKVISSSGSLANVNPLRYRGYYYDTETGLYYLQSRYYDPEVKRFVNADYASSVFEDDGFLSKNLFAYCENCPTVADDQDGQWLNVVIGAVVGAAISGIATWATGGSTAEIVSSTVSGAVSGGFAATGLGGTLGQTVVGAISSGFDTAVGAYHDYKSGKISAIGAVAKTVVGTAVGAAFGAMGAEGTSSFKKSCDLTKKAGTAIKTVVRRSSTTKSAYRAATKTLKKVARYAGKTTVRSIVEGVTSYGISYGSTWYAGKYATWATR